MKKLKLQIVEYEACLVGGAETRRTSRLDTLPKRNENAECVGVQKSSKMIVLYNSGGSAGYYPRLFPSALPASI